VINAFGVSPIGESGTKKQLLTKKRLCLVEVPGVEKEKTESIPRRKKENEKGRGGGQAMFSRERLIIGKEKGEPGFWDVEPRSTFEERVNEEPRVATSNPFGVD